MFSLVHLNISCNAVCALYVIYLFTCVIYLFTLRLSIFLSTNLFFSFLACVWVFSVIIRMNFIRVCDKNR